MHRHSAQPLQASAGAQVSRIYQHAGAAGMSIGLGFDINVKLCPAVHEQGTRLAHLHVCIYGVRMVTSECEYTTTHTFVSGLAPRRYGIR